MPRYLPRLAGVLIVIVLIAAPIAFAVHQQNQMRNFHVVKDGVLYRSGQMTLDGLKRAVHDYGIKTVVSLRDGDKPTDLAEEEYCVKEDIKFIRLPPRKYYAQVGPAPVEENIAVFRTVMADSSNYPVLIHCFAGVHRTGAFCAVYRMEHDHWTNAQAISEMKEFGYINLEDEWDVLGYLEEYKPTWREDAGDHTAVIRKRPPAKPGKRTDKSERKKSG
jgi:protein tyrosine/serine phosphatase